jgi:hypothetical protein
MKRIRSTPFAIFILAAVLALGACNAFDITGEDDDENEVRVTVQSLGADFLVASDGITYRVDQRTDYEGYSGFSEVAVGHRVDIEWEAIAGSSDRFALEIEAEGSD